MHWDFSIVSHRERPRQQGVCVGVFSFIIIHPQRLWKPALMLSMLCLLSSQDSDNLMDRVEVISVSSCARPPRSASSALPHNYGFTVSSVPHLPLHNTVSYFVLYQLHGPGIVIEKSF